MTNKNEVTKYEVDGKEVELTPTIVYKQLLPYSAQQVITETEINNFIALCRYQGLNPFLKEAYLIKYDSKSPAQMIVGKDVFTKRAVNNPLCRGFKAGIIIKSKDGIEYREGTFLLSSEVLLGGWATVYRKDWEVPFKNAVSLSEYSTGKSLWRTKPATMIRKVALVQTLREALPTEFQGLYDQSEMGVDEETIKAYDAPQNSLNDGFNTKTTNISNEQGKAEIINSDASDGDIVDAEFEELNAEDIQQAFDDAKSDETITMPQIQRMFTLGKGNNATIKAIMATYGYTSSKDIKVKDYEGICEKIEELVKEK